MMQLLLFDFFLLQLLLFQFWLISKDSQVKSRNYSIDFNAISDNILQPGRSSYKKEPDHTFILTSSLSFSGCFKMSPSASIILSFCDTFPGPEAASKDREEKEVEEENENHLPTQL